MRKLISVLWVAAIAVLCPNAEGELSFTVRGAYIKPIDAPAPKEAVISKFKNMLPDIQTLYQKEMERHGYGTKTFTLETDHTGQPTVEIVNGSHDMATYQGHTASVVAEELLQKFKYQNHIYVVIMGGIDAVASGRSKGNGGLVDGWQCGRCRGIATIAESSGNFEFSTVAHELGHAFGLSHNLKGKNGENFLMWRGYRLEDYEARWLDKSPYFNDGRQKFNGLPQVTRIQKATSIEMNGTDYVQFKIDISGNTDLYQAKLFRNSDGCVVAWDELTERNDTTDLLVLRSDLLSDHEGFVQFIDVRGNQGVHPIPLVLPTLNSQPTATAPAETANATYLTIDHPNEKSLTPVNPRGEWDGWVGGIWEKPPGGDYPPKPQWYLNFPYMDIWDHWFYSHAPSRIVWDLSAGNYATFDCNFYLAHPCNGIANVEISFLADNTEIYNSGILKPHNAQNKHISFDVPAGTQTLTLVVDPLPEGSCDHFVFGNPQLIHTTTPIKIVKPIGNRTDVNGDGKVTIADLIIVASRYGERVTVDIMPNPDVNSDGIVDIKDITLITEAMPILAAPMLSQPVSTEPISTELLPNYPNPFNPETWIPFRLAESGHIQVDILNTNGGVVRSLDLGYQEAGFYQSRSKAAYWDGRNRFGEPVASGVYFYQLHTRNGHYIRKMLMLK